MKSLLAAGYTPNITFKRRSALERALVQNNFAIAVALINAGADLCHLSGRRLRHLKDPVRCLFYFCHASTRAKASQLSHAPRRLLAAYTKVRDDASDLILLLIRHYGHAWVYETRLFNLIKLRQTSAIRLLFELTAYDFTDIGFYNPSLALSLYYSRDMAEFLVRSGVAITPTQYTNYVRSWGTSRDNPSLPRPQHVITCLDLADYDPRFVAEALKRNPQLAHLLALPLAHRRALRIATPQRIP